jgi:hypothetical protein
VPLLGWVLGGIVAVVLAGLAARRLLRGAVTRAAVFEEVRRTLRDGALERSPVDGTVARGRLGPLVVTVDLQRDPRRPRQSPMWRITAEGRVPLECPVEARVGGWEGWIDPWLQLGETLTVPAATGPPLTLHAEPAPGADHPLVGALRRQGERLGPGALHARHDLMRAETRFGERVEENHALFAYLHVMGEIAELPHTRTSRAAPSSIPRYGVLPEGP